MHGLEYVPSAPNSPNSSQLQSSSAYSHGEEWSDLELMSSYDELSSNNEESEHSQQQSPVASSLSFIMPQFNQLPKVGRLRLTVVGREAGSVIGQLASYMQPNASLSSSVVCSSSPHEKHNVELIECYEDNFRDWLEQHLQLGMPVDAVIYCGDPLPADTERQIQTMAALFYYTDSLDWLNDLLNKSSEIRKQRTLLNARYYSGELSNRPMGSLAPRMAHHYTLKSIDNIDPLRLGDWYTVPRLCGQLLIAAAEMSPWWGLI